MKQLKRRIKSSRMILAVICIIAALCLSSCDLSSLYYLTGDVFDYSYDYLCETLHTDIQKKASSQHINVTDNKKPVDSDIIKADINKFVSEDAYGAYFISNINFSLTENESFSKIDLYITYSDADVKYEDLIETDGVDKSTLVTDAVENIRNGKLVMAYYITDSTQGKELAASLINTIDQNAAIGYTFDSYFYSYYPSSGDNRILQLEFKSDIDEGERNNLNTLLDNKINKISEQIKAEIDENNETAVCKAVHDYIIDNVQYDEDIMPESVKTKSARIERSTYGALILGKTICGGYSEAFLRLYTAVSGKNNCWIMAGYAGTGDNIVGHAWNVVKIDGKDYYIDCTYDDTAKTTDYFMKATNSKEFSDHIIADEYIKGW